MGTFYNTPELNSVALNGSIEYIFGFTDVFNDDFYTWLTPLEKEQIMYYGAFESCGAENYVLPDGVKYIGPAVFGGFCEPESLSLPSTLEKIADDFIGSGKTPVITMRDGGSNAYFDVGQALIAKGAAADAVPASVSEVVPFAFAFANVKWVDFSSSNVTELPAGCFYGSYVEKITLSSKITRLLSDGLPEFDGIPVWARGEIWSASPAVYACEKLTVLENYQGLTEVGDSMFSGTKLTSFDIGENMRLGNNCFFYCWSLQEFNVAEGHPTLSSEDGVLFDKNKQVLLMYPAAKQGLTYTVPASVVYVADVAFLRNAELTSIAFADDSACVSVGASCFASIATLKTITLPATLTNIGVSAFFGNTALEKLVFLSGEMPAVADDYGENNWFKYQPESENPDEWVPARFYSDVTIVCPEGRFRNYFDALYAIAPEIAAALDDSKQPKYDFVFDSKGGSQIASVNGFAALTRPVPARDGYFFWGWYLTDGTASGGVWGEEASFPFWYEGEGTSVTLYARWETERKQDGLSVETGWDFSEQKTVTVSQSGIYYFRFTASASGKLASDANDVPLISAELEAAGAEYRVWVMLFSDQSMENLVSRSNRTVKEGHTYFGTLEIDLPAEMFPFTFTANVVINES